MCGSPHEVVLTGSAACTLGLSRPRHLPSFRFGQRFKRGLGLARLPGGVLAELDSQRVRGYRGETSMCAGRLQWGIVPKLQVRTRCADWEEMRTELRALRKIFKQLLLVTHAP